MVEVRFHSLGGQGAVTLINMMAQAGDQYLARQVDTGRRGTIAQEDFQKLDELKIEEIVE